MQAVGGAWGLGQIAGLVGGCGTDRRRQGRPQARRTIAGMAHCKARRPGAQTSQRQPRTLSMWMAVMRGRMLRMRCWGVCRWLNLPTMSLRPWSMQAPQRSNPMASGQSRHLWRLPWMGYCPAGAAQG